MNYPAINIIPPNKHFPLLDLPIELLLAILSTILVQPGPICLHPPATGHSSTITAKPDNPTLHLLSTSKEIPWRALLTPPPITRTNRFLRNEGLKLFYGENVFHGLNWVNPRPHEWLPFNPAEARRMVTAKGSFLLSSGWEVRDVAAYMIAKAREVEGLDLGFGNVEAASEQSIQWLGAVCEEVKFGKVFVVRFA